MGKPGGVVDILGIFFVFLGTCGLLIQLNSFRVYRTLRRLERSGVEGEATVTRWEPVGGQMRLYFQVCLPEGESAAEFAEVMLEPAGFAGSASGIPGPMGTADQGCL
jgi:hypothetical protein